MMAARRLFARLFGGIAAFWLASAGAQPANNEAPQQESEEPIIVIVPRDLAPQTRRLAGGCWVTFYNQENFEGAQYDYYGPTNVRELWNFVAQVGSVTVGPNARVMLYADPGFRDFAIALGPGQAVSDLPERTDDVHVTFGSMKVRCD